MANENQVKLELDLDLKDSSLRDAKQKLDDFAKQYENAFKARRQALASGGRFSPGFMVSDEELKKAQKNVESAKTHFLKAQHDFENKSKPITKRVGGMLHKWLWGEKVQSGDDADKEQRKAERRMTVFQQKLHGTLALSSHLASTLSPLPGGGVLHAGIAGAAGGYAEGTIDPETGERRKGVRGVAGGLWGGLKGAGMAAGLLALAKGVGGAVQGGQEEENILRMLTHAGGGVGKGREGLALATGAASRGLSGQEAAGVVAGAFRGGGGAESARAAMKAQVGLGLGGEFNRMLGGMAGVGAAGGQEGLDANAKRLWTDVLAAGYDKSLKRLNPRLVVEGLAGALQMVNKQTMGTTMGDPSQIFKMQAFLGQKGAFTGQRGFQMMGQMDSFVKGETSPMARAMSLMQSGLGGGVGMVEAMRRSEQGLFGEKSGKAAVDKTKDFVGRFSQMAGGNRDLASLLMSQAGGMSVSSATELFDLVKEGKFGEKEYEEMKTKALPLEDQAYKAMASMDWATINKLLESIKFVLDDILAALGGKEGVKAVLEETRELLKSLRDFIKDVKENGFFGATAKRTFGSKMTEDELYASGGYMPKETYGINDKTFKDMKSRSPQGAIQRAVQQAYDLAEARGLSPDQFKMEQKVVQDTRGQFHFVVELQEPSGQLIAAMEAFADQGSKPSQAPAVKKKGGKRG